MTTVLEEFLLDRNGERRKVAAAVAEWIGPSLPTAQDVIAFLIHKLGYARFQVRHRSCRAYLNCHSIVDEAAVALAFSLHDYSTGFSGAIFIEDQTGLVKRFADHRGAIDYLVARVSRLSSARRPAFSRHSVPLSATPYASFRALADLCPQRGIPDIGLVRGQLERHFENRYCVVEPGSGSDRLVLTEFGNGYAHIDDQWSSRRVGTPFGEFVDAEYSRFVKRAYEQAWRSWAPSLEAIEVRHPTAGLPALYHRVLLPMLWGNRRVLLSTSLID